MTGFADLIRRRRRWRLERISAPAAQNATRHSRAETPRFAAQRIPVSTMTLVASLILAPSIAASPAQACSGTHAQTLRPQFAQATPPLQSTPGAETKPSASPEPADVGARPREIPPEPARPDPAAVDAGAKPALPPAPAEKMGEPVKAK